MTSPLTSGSGYTTPISSLIGQPSTPSTSAGGNEMGKDAFLKLLVAQLKYQDPMNPAEGAEFVAQTAQFTQVEKLSELAAAQQDMVSAQLMQSASNMVGRTVTYIGADGAGVTGVVTSATLGSSPTLKVGNMDVPLSLVTEVRQTGS